MKVVGGSELKQHSFQLPESAFWKNFKRRNDFSVTLLKTSYREIQVALLKVDEYHPRMCNITSYVYFPQHLYQIIL